MGGSSSVCLGQILCGLPAKLAVCVLVHGGIGPHGGLLAARFVAGGVARVSREGPGLQAPLLPELRAGARLQLQTNSAQPHCSHRHWHPQSRGVCAVTNPGRLSSHAGGPSAKHPTFQQGDVFLLGRRGDISF